MAIKTVSETLNDLSPEVSQELCSALEATIQNETEFPSFLSIHLVDPDEAADYLQYVATNAANSTGRPRRTLHFHLSPDDSSLPAELHDRLSTLQQAYQAWHTHTVITENFSSDSLSFRLDVPLDEDGRPTEPSLRVFFEMWGLPESGIPTFSEVLNYNAQQHQPTTRCY